MEKYNFKSISIFPIKFEIKTTFFSSERFFLTEERAIVLVRISILSIWRPSKIVIKNREGEKKEKKRHFIIFVGIWIFFETPPEWKWENLLQANERFLPSSSPRFDVI